MFCEVSCNFYDDEEKCTYVDGWFTDSDEEEGVVVAKVYDNGTVVYANELYKTMQEVVEVVNDVLKAIKNND